MTGPRGLSHPETKERGSCVPDTHPPSVAGHWPGGLWEGDSGVLLPAPIGW